MEKNPVSRFLFQKKYQQCVYIFIFFYRVSSVTVLSTPALILAPFSGAVIKVETMRSVEGIAPCTLDEHEPAVFCVPLVGARFGKFVAQKSF